MLVSSPLRSNKRVRWTAIVERNISMPGVLVFSKTYCSFCAKLKALLRELRIPFRTEVRGGGGGDGGLEHL